MPIASPMTPACGTLAMPKLFLIDTCALLWLASNPDRISSDNRFIIATALKMNLPVVTNDDNFPKYGVQTVI